MPVSLLAAVLLTAIVSKIGIFAWGVSHYPFEQHPDADYFSIWQHWDAAHYLHIAEHGYSPEKISAGRFQLFSHFPPFYPLVVAIVSKMIRFSVADTGMLVSFVCGVAATCLLASLAWHEFRSWNTAFWSSLLFLAYPVSYFFITPYSESLYMVLVLVTFHLLRVKERPIASSIASALAVLTRLMGIALASVYACRIIVQLRGGTFRLRNAATLVPAALAAFAYLALNRVVWGDWFFFLHHVYTDPSIPRTPRLPMGETFESLKTIVSNTLAGTYDSGFMNQLGWGAVLTMFAFSVSILGAAAQIIPWDYSVYSLSYILFYSSYNWGISNARYSIGAFPIFFVLARLRPKFLAYLWLALFTFGLLYFSKRFVWEYWAF